jgi:methylenetetrahydrofolate--tRNA-(uracil-5-)-methyltransferase
MRSVVAPRHTMLGALIEYITTPKKDFQPMNANFGIIPDVPKMKKDQRIRFIVERALREMENFAEKISTLK